MGDIIRIFNKHTYNTNNWLISEFREYFFDETFGQYWDIPSTPFQKIPNTIVLPNLVSIVYTCMFKYISFYLQNYSYPRKSAACHTKQQPQTNLTEWQSCQQLLGALWQNQDTCGPQHARRYTYIFCLFLFLIMLSEWLVIWCGRRRFWLDKELRCQLNHRGCRWFA